MQVQELKDVCALAIGVAELLDNVADGVSLGDIISVVGVLKKVKPAVDAIKSGKALEEFRALDDMAKAEVGNWFNEEFEISNDKVESVIEQAFVSLLALNELLVLIGG